MKKIKCEKCGMEKTEIQLAWEGVLFFRVDGNIICEICKEEEENVGQ
jgi:uncharacterized Zn finger protein (UPF0148 family)